MPPKGSNAAANAARASIISSRSSGCCSQPPCAATLAVACV
ncbi:MAG: hypothetical protein IPG65_11475 [Ottowia sp.]|nr:hypothetical protein [Ottowia sp.]